MIPCTIWIRDGGVSIPVYYTKTYFGAKRIKKKLEVIKPRKNFTIHEVWNIPSDACFYVLSSPAKFRVGNKKNRG